MTDPATGQSPPCPPKRVLLVEDNEAARKGLARLLDALGFEVTTVHDGTSALERLAADPPPEVLLTDLSLPDLDGREVARQARDRFPHLRIILVTGWDVEEGVASLESWGIDTVLTKPVDVQTLVSHLNGTAGAGH